MMIEGKFKIIRAMLDGYMGARSEEARKMYARYLSFVSPFLFEEYKNNTKDA